MEALEEGAHTPGVSASSSLQLHSDGAVFERQGQVKGKRKNVSSDVDNAISAVGVEYLSGFRLWITMVAMMLSIFLIAMDMTIVATAVPAITNEFNGIKDQAWYASAFFLTSGGFQSAWGKIYQNFPLKASFLVAILIFEVGSTICAAAPSSVIFIIGRAIAGVGAAGVGSGSYTIVAFISEPRKRANHTSMIGAIFGIESVLGPLIGGAFSANVSWRWCFYINLPIGVPPLLATIFFFHTPKAAIPREGSLRTKLLQVDPLGLTLLLAGIVTYLLAVQYGGTSKPWNSGTVIGLLITSVVTFILFGIVELWQGERATVIPRLFAKRLIGMSMIYISFQGGALFAMVYYLPLYFQAILGDSAVLAGAHNLAFIVPAMISVLVAGMIVTNTGMVTPVMAVGSAIGALGCGLCSLFDRNTTAGAWIGYQIVAGIGLGLGFQIPLTASQASISDESDLAAVTSMLLEFQTLGGAIWVSAAQAVFVNRMLIALPQLAPNVDPTQVIAAGAGDLRALFGSAQLPGILGAYSDGIKCAYLLICALVGVSMLVTAGMPWRKLDVHNIPGGA